METFDTWAQLILCILGTIGAGIAILLWKSEEDEARKKRLLPWEILCIVATGAFVWVTFYSGNEVSSRQEKKFAAVTNQLERVEADFFSNMIYETISGFETNRVARLYSTNTGELILLKLQFVPIEKSIQLTVDSGNLPKTYPLDGSMRVNNVVFLTLFNYNLPKTSFRVQYVKSKHQGNLIRNVSAVEGLERIAMFDGQLITFNVGLNQVTKTN